MSRPFIQIAEDLPEIREGLRRILARHGTSEMLRRAEGPEAALDQILWNEVASGGWLGLVVPEAGLNRDVMLALHLALVEIGYAGEPVPLGPSAGIVGPFLGSSLSDDASGLRQRVAEGEVWVPVLPDGLTDSAFSVSEDFVSGTATFVRSAGHATGFLLLGHTADSVAWYAVPREPQSARLTYLPNMAGSQQYTLSLRRAPAQRIATADATSVLELATLTRFAQVSVLAGLCWRALDMSVAHAVERRQFGRAIGSFQAVQHKLANITIMTQLLMHLTRDAAATIGAEGIAATTSRAAAAEAVNLGRRAANLTAQEVHQIWGGAGVSVEYDLQLFTRRIKSMAYLMDEVDEVATDVLSLRYPTSS